MGEIIGFVAVLGCIAAGWKGVRFVWPLALAGALLVAGFVFDASMTLIFVGVIALLFWYGLGRGARHLFGGGTGYSE